MIESSLQSEPVTLPVRPSGSVARSAVAYGVGTGLMLISPLLVFAPAALFHCALRNGRKAAWGAFAVAITLTSLYFAQVASASAPKDVKFAYTWVVAVILAIAVPSMAALPLVGSRRKFGDVLVFTLIASAVGLGLTEVAMRTFADFSPLAMYVEQLQQGVTMARTTSPLLRDAERWMPMFMTVVPGMLLIDTALAFVLSLLMYGRITTSWKRAADGSTTVQNDYLFRTFALPEWTLFAFVFGGLTPLTDGFLQRLAANVLMVVVFLYLLQGMAIMRAVLVRAGVGMFGTLFAFLLLVLLSAGTGLFLLMLAGLFDPFFDFRHLKRKDDSHESHTD